MAVKKIKKVVKKKKVKKVIKKNVDMSVKYYKNGKLVSEYDSIEEAADDNRLSARNIKAMLDGSFKSKGFMFEGSERFDR